MNSYQAPTNVDVIFEESVPMDPAAYEEFQKTLESSGVDAALDELKRRFMEEQDAHRVFETLTLRARRDLGLPLLIRTDPAKMSPDIRQAYEDRVIEACREVGMFLLNLNRIPEAFTYFNMIGETDLVRDAIDRFESSDDDQRVEGVIDIAIGQGVHPRKGLELVLGRFGTCQAITMCEGILSHPWSIETKQACVKLLVRRLHEELTSSVAAHIAQNEKEAPATGSLTLLLKDRDWLFDNDNYHIDTSHLNAVVRFSRLLEKCEEVFLAIQLCDYGIKLSDRYRYAEPTPFENIYADSRVYLKAVTDVDVDKALEHFKVKADRANLAEVGTYPAEVYVALLELAGKSDEAISYAGRRLNDPTLGGQLSINELCLRHNRVEKLAQLARRRDDLLSFAAAEIQRKS
jgi:hypothetical protein